MFSDTLATQWLSPFAPSFWDRMACVRAAGNAPHLGAYEAMERLVETCLAGLSKPTVLIGHCLGGYLALELLSRRPRDVAGVILINSSASADTPLQARIRSERIGKLEALKQTQRLPDMEYVRHATAWMLSDASCQDPDIVGYAARLLGEQPVDASYRQQKLMLGRESREGVLARARCPILIIAGERDRISPPGLSESMHRRAASSALEILPECGHLAPIERPGEVAAAIMRWSRRHFGGTRHIDNHPSHQTTEGVQE